MSYCMTVIPEVKVFDALKFPEYVQDEMSDLFDDMGAGCLWHHVGDDPDDIFDMFLVAQGAEVNECVLIECYPEE